MLEDYGNAQLVEMYRILRRQRSRLTGGGDVAKRAQPLKEKDIKKERIDTVYRAVDFEIQIAGLRLQEITHETL